MTLHQQTQMAFVAAASSLSERLAAPVSTPAPVVVEAARPATTARALKVIPNVTLLRAGENWHLSTGDRTFTSDDLAAAVAALDDPAIHTPILKLGHDDKRPGFGGQPAFGKIINLRTENDGMDLVGDIAGVPEWMAEAMPTAWPTRSIEGAFGYTTATGNTHPFVITALALLAEGPAIETLEDLPLALGLVAAETALTPGTERFSGQVAASAPVMASVSYEDVRRAYYETIEDNPACCWWWIRELVIDPPQLIVCDDSDALWQIAYTIKGQEITFGEPVAVRVEYVAASATPQTDRITFASRNESRPENQEKEASMDLTALRTRLGVAADVPDDEVLSLAVSRLPGGDVPAPPDPITPTATQTVTPETKVTPPATNTITPEPKPAEDKAPETTPEPAPEPKPEFQVPAGMALVDASLLNQIQAKAEAGAAVAARVAQEDEDRFIEAVVASGRLHPEPTQSPEVHKMLRASYRRNKEEASMIAASMAVVFPTRELGYAGTGEVNASAVQEVWTAQDEAIFPELREVRNNGKV